jgi:hypothetical protein
MSEVFDDLKMTLQEHEYHSPFDFEKFGISDRDKKAIIAKEEIIIDNAKKYAKSLFEICKAVYDVRVILKSKENGELSFTEWYKAHGLNKDKVSELIKRYELYIQAPDKIDFITSLSIPAVKELTRKTVDIDSQILAIEYGLKDAKEIKTFLSTGQLKEKQDTCDKEIEEAEIIKTDDLDEEEELNLYNDNVLKKLDEVAKILVDCHYDNFSQLAKSPSRLSKYKNNVQALQKFLKEVSNDIESALDSQALKNNLRLPE